MATTTPNLSVLKQKLFQLFEKFDENGDNVIDFEEFKKAMIHSRFVNPNDSDIDTRISQLFAKFDTDGSGTIKYTEFMHHGSKFTAFLNHLNIPFVDDTMHNMMDEDVKTNATDRRESEFAQSKQTQELQQKVTELETWIDQYKAQMLQYKDEADTAEMKLTIMIQKSAAMDEEIQQLRDDKTILETNASELLHEIAELKNDKIHLQSLSLANDNESQFQKEIFELTNKLEKNRNDLMIYKSKNHEQSVNMASLTSKMNKMTNINKQLQRDNEQLIQSTDEITMYCSELELNLENAENKMNELNSESLYDNVMAQPPPRSGFRRSRNRNMTLDMRGFDAFEPPAQEEHNEYESVDLGDGASEAVLPPRQIMNVSQSLQAFRRSSGSPKRMSQLKKFPSLRMRASTLSTAANFIEDKQMKEVQNMLKNIKSDIGAMNIEMSGGNGEIVNAINQSFALFKAAMRKDMRDDLRQIVRDELVQYNVKKVKEEAKCKLWWEWW
eukprot:79690_1